MALLRRQGAGAWQKRFVLLPLPAPNLHLSLGKATSLGPDPALCPRPQEVLGGEGGHGSCGGRGWAVPGWARVDVRSRVTLASPAPQTPARLLPGAGFGCIKEAAKQTQSSRQPWGFSANPGAAAPVPLGPCELSKASFKPTTSQRLVCGTSWNSGMDQRPQLMCPPRVVSELCPATAATESRRGVNLLLSLWEKLPRTPGPTIFLD